MECISYCIAEKINLIELERKIRSISTRKTIKSWNVLEISDKDAGEVLYVFANGTFVTWNIKRYRIKNWFPYIEPFCIGYLKRPLKDEFSYSLSTRTGIRPHEYFNIEYLTLENDDHELKLSLSYGFSQSIKLKHYEEKMDSLIAKYTPHTLGLSRDGRMTLSRTEIRRIIGDILLVKGDLNLTCEFLYRPKFFWANPGLEQSFVMLETYLDFAKRTQSLNQQLNTLNEIFFMFNSYLESKHAHFLEMIIILLIAVEIIFSLWNIHF